MAPVEAVAALELGEDTDDMRGRAVCLALVLLGLGTMYGTGAEVVSLDAALSC